MTSLDGQSKKAGFGSLDFVSRPTRFEFRGIEAFVTVRFGGFGLLIVWTDAGSIELSESPRPITPASSCAEAQRSAGRRGGDPEKGRS